MAARELQQGHLACPSAQRVMLLPIAMRENSRARNDRSLNRTISERAASGLSEEYFRHHSLIFMTQEMTVKERHAANDGISEIHHEIDRTAIGDIHGIHPYWSFHRFVIDGIWQEVDLMNVKRVHFFGWIQHAPMLQ